MIQLAVCRHLLLLVVLSLSFASANAYDRSTGGTLERFERAGVVERVNSTEIIVNGKQYRFSTSIYFMNNSVRKSLDTIREGDRIWVKGRILIGVPYIDTMTIFPDDES